MYALNGDVNIRRMCHCCSQSTKSRPKALQIVCCAPLPSPNCSARVSGVALGGKGSPLSTHRNTSVCLWQPQAYLVRYVLGSLPGSGGSPLGMHQPSGPSAWFLPFFIFCVGRPARWLWPLSFVLHVSLDLECPLLSLPRGNGRSHVA